MNRSSKPASIVPFLVLLLSGQLIAATVVLPVLDDATILTNSGSNGPQDNNFGGRDELIVGDINAADLRSRYGLLRFDTSGVSAAIAAGESVVSITLRLHLRESRGATAGANTLEVYRFSDSNASWVEGSSNGSLELGASSFGNLLERDVGGDVPWAGGVGADNPGVDHSTDTLGTFSIPDGATGFIEVDLTDIPGSTLTDMVTTWDGGTNAGLFLRMTDDTGVQFFFDSNESVPGANVFPASLVVETVPEPGAATLALLGAVMAGAHLGRRRETMGARARENRP